MRKSAFATAHADPDRDGWTGVVARYQGFCALVDTQVGDIFGDLEHGGQLDRTIVVYATDGDMMGAHRTREASGPERARLWRLLAGDR